MQRVVITMTYEDDEQERRIVRYVSDNDAGETSISVIPSLIDMAVEGLRNAANELEENRPQ